VTDDRGGDGSAETTDNGPPLLAVDALTVAYGAVEAIRDVSLTVAPGEIVAALGPNGAGKTTLLRTLAGALKPQHGSVTFDGDPLTGLSPETVVRRMSRTRLSSKRRTRCMTWRLSHITRS